MLGEDNPIRSYGDVTLYEDEFADRGYSKANARYRVMDNCFFILLRSYVRIDHVAVRILDTRIFHEFNKDFIIRDFTHLESTYEELQSKDFNLDSDWLLSPH
jgi:type 2A phosphatase activator TIP41